MGSDWIGSISTNHAIAGNWDPSGVPGTGDDATFDISSQGDCLVTAPWALASLTMDAAMPDNIDLATFDLTMDDGGSVILDGSGTFDMGTGTLSITNGVFDNRDVNTFVWGTSELSLSGTSTIISNISNDLYDVTIESDATITVDASTTSRFDFRGTLDVIGDLILNNNTGGGGSSANVTVQATGSITGSSNYSCSSGSSIALNDGLIDVGTLQFTGSTVSTVFAPGDYGLSKIRITAGSTSTVLRLNAAAYVFAELELEATSTGAFLLDNSANDPTSITVGGDFIIDLNSTGDITIDDSGTSTAWHLQGDVLDQISGGGTFTWIAGSEPITFDGMNDVFVDMDFGGVSLPAIVIDKPLGSFTLAGDIEVAEFTGTDVSEFDPGSFTITVIGDCDFAAAFDPGVGDWNGCIWDIGGNFTLDGQEIFASSTWELNVVGSAIASGVGAIQNCDASGGSPLYVIGWTDLGGNTNVIFNNPWWFRQYILSS